MDELFFSTKFDLLRQAKGRLVQQRKSWVRTLAVWEFHYVIMLWQI